MKIISETKRGSNANKINQIITNKKIYIINMHFLLIYAISPTFCSFRPILNSIVQERDSKQNYSILPDVMTSSVPGTRQGAEFKVRLVIPV